MRVIEAVFANGSRTEQISPKKMTKTQVLNTVKLLLDLGDVIEIRIKKGGEKNGRRVV